MDNANVVPPLRMPLHLLEEITNYFSEEQKIGHGSCARVYMGDHRKGEKIAVKVLHNNFRGLDDTKFEEEVVNLACIQHKNVVRLVGHCHETTRECFQQNGRLVFADLTKRAICFEYMHNGSLDKFFSDESNGHDWCTRYAIIKGICDGLKYLHEELESPMYHLDIKPRNILLDERLVPKISNFGLSKFFRDGQEEITKKLVGTRGYLPPEYINQGLISNKFDIFSLGVTIIEIMAGRQGYYRCVEMSSREFIENVHSNWTNRLQETSVDELESYCKQVKACAEISLRCVEYDRHKRPSIGAIVKELNETETMIQIADALRNDTR